MAHQFEGIHVPDWSEVKGYFTTTDVQHMLAYTGGQIDLSSCQSVLKNADEIYKKVSKGQMPPGNPWPAEKINGFFSWWKSNPTCP